MDNFYQGWSLSSLTILFLQNLANLLFGNLLVRNSPKIRKETRILEIPIEISM